MWLGSLPLPNDERRKKPQHHPRTTRPQDAIAHAGAALQPSTKTHSHDGGQRLRGRDERQQGGGAPVEGRHRPLEFCDESRARGDERLLRAARSRRPAVLRRLHAIDARRLREGRSWVVSFSISGPFGPSRDHDAPRRPRKLLQYRRSTSHRGATLSKRQKSIDCGGSSRRHFQRRKRSLQKPLQTTSRTGRNEFLDLSEWPGMKKGGSGKLRSMSWTARIEP